MASSDQLTITVKGRGGHGSSPHFALDPIPVACEIVQAIQTLVTRRIDVFDPGVITVTSIHSGTAYNVIPEHATILGTILHGLGDIDSFGIEKRAGVVRYCNYGDAVCFEVLCCD